MFGKRFEIRPEPRLAAKLTLILWLAVLSFIAPSAILLGQVESIGDLLSLFTGMITGLLMATLLYGSFVLMAGRPIWLGFVGVAAAVLAVAFLQTAADYAGQHALDLIFDINLPSHQPRFVMTVLVVYFALYICNAALFWTSFTQQQVKEQAVRAAHAEVRAAQAEMQAAQSELARLRLQLDPHFMCNSLGAVAGLIETGRAEAARKVSQRLADFLRASLESHDLDEVPVAEELDVVDAYLDVEGARFEDRLTVSLSCPEDLHDALVPSFILQPLVENALKHGVGSVGAIDLRISVQRAGDRLVMTVENDRTSREAPTVNARGIGLRNVRERLQMKFGAAAELTAEPVGDCFRAEIRLPYRSALAA